MTSYAMKLSSSDLFELKIIDEIILEPLGGAHRDKDLILDNVRNSIKKNLDFFSNMNKEEILLQRKNKFLLVILFKPYPWINYCICYIRN